ncbi:MAG: HU family DNA-binding protein [Deltaproteobacteria bacterium]|nr:HU family DNA-binding protein [Deltaproteobacteria bacterium]
MTWNELIAAVAAKTGRSQTQTRELLDATMEQIVLALAEGEKVPLKGVGVLSSVWREARTVRSITNRRRMMVDGRYLPRFRPAQACASASRCARPRCSAALGTKRPGVWPRRSSAISTSTTATPRPRASTARWTTSPPARPAVRRSAPCGIR